MESTKTVTIQIEMPAQLLAEVQTLVREGWYRSPDEAFIDALRRLVESRHTELAEQFMREDIQWGLHGKE